MRLVLNKFFLSRQVRSFRVREDPMPLVDGNRARTSDVRPAAQVYHRRAAVNRAALNLYRSCRKRCLSTASASHRSSRRHARCRELHLLLRLASRHVKCALRRVFARRAISQLRPCSCRNRCGARAHAQALVRLCAIRGGASCCGVAGNPTRAVRRGLNRAGQVGDGQDMRLRRHRARDRTLQPHAT
jgi:hypothetical protein